MVLIRHIGGDWHEPDTAAYGNEKELQDLVRLSPTLLPGGVPQAMVDEFRIPEVGSIDLVGVGASGLITLVECKLRANPEIRREVVGQVLAYAGGLWRMSYDDFAETFALRAGKSLFESVREATGEDVDSDELRESVRQHLAEGEFHMVVAVDKITPELRKIIEFLNGHTNASVRIVALELGYGRDGDIEYLIPEVYGETSELPSAKSRWNAGSFAEQVQKLTDGSERAFIEKLLDHGGQKGHHPFYGSGTKPGMSYYYDIDGHPVSVWGLYLMEPVPKVAISFGAIATHSLERANSLLRHLRKNPQLNSALAGTDEDNLKRKYPQIRINPVLLDPATQEFFFSALDEVISPSAAQNTGRL